MSVATVARKKRGARRKKPRAHTPPRDTAETPFMHILGDLLKRVPGAFASALVDYDGETVDYAGSIEPFDIRVAAAHIRIVLHQMAGVAGASSERREARWLVIRGATRSIVARMLPDDYALVVLLRRRAGFTASRRAFAVCERALASEADWKRVEERPAWFPLEVEIDRRGRPKRIGPRKTTVEVLGSLVGLPARERGFRVRTSTGAEITLVREARNCWYADEAVSAMAVEESPKAPVAREKSHGSRSKVRRARG